MTNLITRTNGDPFATEGNAKCARTWKGLTHTHEVIQHGGGWVLREKQSGAAVTLQPGDYIATKDLTEDEYHAVARAFMAAGATDTGIDLSDVGDLLGWDVRDNEFYHGSDDSYYKQEVFTGRQLTLSQILSATNAGGGVDQDNDTTIDSQQQMKPTMHITDLLFQARKERDAAQSRYEQVMADHRATYPWLVIEERADQPSEDMSDPANWLAGDIVEPINDSTNYFKGSHVKIHSFDKDGDLILENDADKRIGWGKHHFRFVRRP
nr:hypothetical protein [uncultured Halomonas sp.]